MLNRKLYLLFLLIMVLAGQAEASLLPDAFGEWAGTPAHITEFTLTKDNENLGQWENRVYTRSAPIARVEANLMEGPGPGALFVPDGKAPESTGLFPAPSSYETMNVAGKRAVLESGELAGQALAVTLDANRTLTLETLSLSREELLTFAQRLIDILEDKQ